MKTVQKTAYNKIGSVKRSLIIIVGVLMIIVLAMSLFSRNVITRSRTEGEYTVVQDVVMIQVEEGTECRFDLGQIDHAETLAFYIPHHEIAVYVGQACVYTLTAAKDNAFATVGGVWVSIPLYESDTGKEVKVLLTPIYDDYQTEMPEFLIGSEIALHNVTLHRALPALILALCVMFVGFLLLCIAVYHNAKGMFSGRLYALGVMAVCTGLWRISYDRVAYLLLPDHAVTVYTLSLISMMGTALSLLYAMETDKKEMKFIHYCTYGYCAVYILQLLMQALGIADIRQTLKAIHITILISAAIFVATSVYWWIQPKSQRKGIFGWILGGGVIIDLILYYFADSSVYIVFTLVAILCYAVLEGFRLLFAYVEREKELEEMEMQLSLSRTTTMMSQIRSHFVFNVLNAISGLCKYDPEKADETVVCFARYLRNNIDIMEKDGNIPFTTDLRQIEDYVALEQVRFGDKIELYTDIEVSNFMIPPLILQPVVENAIRHGVSKKIGNGSIILRTREEKSNIIITIEDDGIGFELSELEKEKSVGVRNIRFRLEHMVHGRLDIQSEVGKGTIVTITIPKEGEA